VGKLTAVVYRTNLQRSAVVADGMAHGIKRSGDTVIERLAEAEQPKGDVAVFYGLVESTKATFENYLAAGKHVLFVDLGYWGRRDGGRFIGYHRIAFDHRHPTPAQLDRVRCPGDRFEKFGLEPAPMRRAGSRILLAGMSDKGAKSYGFQYQEWEREALARMALGTKRVIAYRPKPSRSDPQKPINGIEFAGEPLRLKDALADAWAVVTHHSNVGIDGLLSGVPCFCAEGIIKAMAKTDLREIERPYYPDYETRLQWFRNVAYWQWSVPEMAKGLPWQWLKESGFLPT
jgi:hypothetical protein